MKRDCEVCGNKRDSMSLLCPFCGSRSETEPDIIKKPFLHKTINLETGRPIVEVALNRMAQCLRDASLQGVTVLTLIHGYGSSGKGGVIRTECRKSLDFMQAKGQITKYIPGEEFHHRAGPVKRLLGRYPRLKNDPNLNMANKGITLVFLE